MSSSQVKVTLDERKLRRLTESLSKDIISRLNREFRAMSRQYKGRDLGTIETAVARTIRKNGGSATKYELTKYAIAIRK